MTFTPAPSPEDESLLPVLRALESCRAVISRVLEPQIEAMGLTPAQFDVLATLGDTPGMTNKELGERTLITRGTLTPVLDRMEAKGLVHRCKGATDARQTLVSLTPEGQAAFERTFYPHVAQARRYLDRLDPGEQEQLVALLGKLRHAFQEPLPPV